MNIQRACAILEIDPYQLQTHPEILVQQYRHLALKYHPDKNPENKEDATLAFQEINEAYSFLRTRTEDNTHSNETNSLFQIWLKMLMPQLKPKLEIVLGKLFMLAETSAMEYLNKNIGLEMLVQVYEAAKAHQHVLHLKDEWLKKLWDLIEKKRETTSLIILNPNIDDLFMCNLYVLTVDTRKFIVPLWHSTLVFDNSGNELYVKCIPVLPPNVEIDDANNLVVDVFPKLNEWWNQDTFMFNIGMRTYSLHPKKLCCVESQQVVFKEMGIPAIQSSEMYDTSVLRDIIVNIHVCIE